MAFTYDETLADNVSRVRFHAALTDPSAPHVLSDAAITGLVALQGSWQGAVAAIYWRRAADLSKAATSATDTDGSVTYSPAELRAIAERWDAEAAAATSTPSDLPLAVVGTMGTYAGAPSALWRA